MTAFLLKIRYRIEYLLCLFLYAVLRVLPEGVALRAGGLFGGLLYHAVPLRRRTGLVNLEIAFPDVPERERRRILRKSLSNLGRVIVSIGLLPTFTDDEIRRRVSYSEGSLENLRKASEKGKGLFFVTAHIGNWELLALAHSLHGHPFSVFARRRSNPHLERIIENLRTRGGNVVITAQEMKAEGARELIGALRKGGAIGILVDQAPRGPHGVLVPFFGKLAWTLRVPALLALRTGAALVPAFLRPHPSEQGRYLIYFGPEIPKIDSGDRDEDVRKLSEQLQGVIEAEVRARPEEWFWVHRRWKRSPDLVDPYPAPVLRTWRRSRRSRGASSA